MLRELLFVTNILFVYGVENGVCPWGLEAVLPKSNSSKTAKKIANCRWKEWDEVHLSVQMLDGTFFESVNNVTTPHNRSEPGLCAVVLFYSPTCPFSIQAAPYFNALPMVFPQISFYAIDGSSSNAANLLYQFVIPALPSIIVFHKNWPFYYYNHTEYSIESFTKFIAFATKLPPLYPISSAEVKNEGPVPTQLAIKPDYCLLLAWTFTLTVLTVYAGKSSSCQKLMDSIKNIWREVEIQHQHVD
ncbi:thioredoxin domain-containing protein 15 [Lepeophtheirus salmonis]|uniref:Thioredoxin domain containing 15 [Acyrthosiphon pisum] n=1 Tax=Lepeophtheirus salmonis TaxID=72036 RepID=A0A0K2TU61_LEPSM|nr:thioredoxin domain-containing protein 15-like [Lepeophtheirus salmonis]